MTALLTIAAGVFFAYAVYMATAAARLAARPGEFLDAGLAIPTWGYIFAATGVIVAGLGLHDHLLLVTAYGLQYSHVAVGLVLVALAGALIQKRVWLAARVTGLRTGGELLGEYFNSPTIRIYILFLIFLFSVPLAAYWLTGLGALLAGATDGALPASLVIWTAAFFLFLCSVIGGWRAVVYVVAAQGLLVFALLLFVGGFIGATFDSLALFSQGIATPDGVLWDRVPGVIQFTPGIGKQAPAGGLWPTAAIVSFAVALVGLALSPGFAFLGITTSTKNGFAFEQVWMTAGIAAGALLLVTPIIAAEMAAASPAAPGGDPNGLSRFIAVLGSVDRLAAVCFVLLIAASLQIGIMFFAASGASLVTIELVARYVLPGLTEPGHKLAARIALAAIYVTVVLAATFAPLSAAIFSSLALSLSAQMLPAFVGLGWLPWISRSGVITGLVLGTILVVFTEPFGLIVLEGLFLDLPWGRWPLTIHSAGWGLAANVAACLLVSLVTRAGPTRDHRQRLHDAFDRQDRVRAGSLATRRAVWSLALLWAFLALGPGAILGNTFFSQPIFAGEAVDLGLPSLLAWQIVFWLVGVLIVWWLAYRVALSTIAAAPGGRLLLNPPTNRLHQQRTPPWIARLLGRVVTR